MDERDFENYLALFDVMISYLRPPDLIICLRASVDTLLDRIDQRGRNCEKTIPREYLETLNKAYHSWWDRARSLTQLLEIDTDEVDLLSEDAMGDLVEEVALRVGYQLEIPLNERE